MDQRSREKKPDFPPGSSTELTDVGEVAELLKCSVRHVYRLSDRGRMPQPIRLGGIVRWSKSELQRWIEDGCPDMRHRSRERV